VYDGKDDGIGPPMKRREWDKVTQERIKGQCFFRVKSQESKRRHQALTHWVCLMSQRHNNLKICASVFRHPRPLVLDVV
jgi:hypothetical protein